MNDLHSLLLPCLVCIPACAGIGVLAARSMTAVLSITGAGIGCGAILGCFAAAATASRGVISSLGTWLRLDALSSFNMIVMVTVYVMSTLYAFVYFKEEWRSSAFSLKQARHFGALWCAAFSSMALVLVSNNLGIMWVGVEATTLLTAFLICIHSTRHSLEAMWKYLLICSVGVAFAFMGTLLVAASSRHVPGLDIHQALLWTRLRDHAANLNPALIKAAFIFLVVGYGTKAGLAPMHNWLPDAHSQAPAPVSALFSGFMLNAALYCIMRYLPIVETATGCSGWALTLLTVLGLFSIGIGAAFIVFQYDVKRLLAYCSVEHIGIISLGVGLGGIGVFAALFHTLNHSLCKSVSFFAAGRLGQRYGTLDLRALNGAGATSRLWGSTLFVSLLVLIGVAPFALFMSEFQILRAAVDAHAYVRLALFLGGLSIVFISMLSRAIPLMWGEAATRTVSPDVHSRLEIGLAVLPLAALLVLGCWMPGWLGSAITKASAVVTAGAAFHHY